MKMFLQTLCLFPIGGVLYVLLEFAWRGRSHWSMFLLGGACFCVVGLLDELWPGAPLSVQAVLGGALVTAMELVCGLLVNRRCSVWDYRAMPYQFCGQICLPFAVGWCLLCAVGVRGEDALRHWLFADPMPPLVWF